MASVQGVASGYDHLLTLLANVIKGQPHEVGRTFTMGTATVAGNGSLFNVLVNATAATQTWTLSCTTGGTAAIFSVVGSSSGTAAAATVSASYSVSGAFSLTVINGTTAFAAGNMFTFVIGSGIGTASQWTINSFDGTTLYAQGPGAGTDSIFVGITLVNSTVGDYYNWKIGGFTGYNSGSAFALQPGYSGESVTPIHMPLWNSDISYWFVVNSQRIIVVAKVSTVYEMCYLGFLNPYASPGQYPYPLVVGGMLAWGNTANPAATSANWRWSYTGTEHRAFWECFTNSSLGFTGFNPATGQSQYRIRLPNGTWRDIWSGANSTYDPSDISGGSVFFQAADLATWSTNSQTNCNEGGIWPSVHGLTAMEANTDGSYLLMPCVTFLGVQSGDAPDILGEFDGVFRVSGGLAAEDILTYGGDSYLMVPNAFRQNRQDYCAVRLT